MSVKLKLDGWKNFLTGMGTKRDKTTHTRYHASPVLLKEELASIWNGEGIGARIVACPAEDMTREWIEITNDPDNKLKDECERLGLQKKIQEASQWARLFGGSIIVIGTSDGDLSEPRKGNEPITFLKCYPRSRVMVQYTDAITDPKSPYFEDVSRFQVLNLSGSYFNVHRSRCLVFHGQPFAYPSEAIVSWEERYWGMSAIQQTYSQIKALGSAFAGVSTLIDEYNISVFKVSNLAELIASGQERMVQNRISIIDQTKSMINSVLIGEGEEYRRETATLSGMDSVLDRFFMLVAGVSGIPVTRLFGRSAAGLNSTGENEMTQYYDRIKSDQNYQIGPQIQEILNYMSSYLWNGEKVNFTFNPLWTPTPVELLDMKSKQAVIDEKYVGLGVYTAEEVRESRFENGFSFETSIDDEMKAPPLDQKPEDAMKDLDGEK